MNMSSMSDRLAKARADARFASAAEAATALGIPYATYAAHENGSRGFTAKSAERYARKFKVSLEWLLTGRGKPSDNRGESGIVRLDEQVEGLPILGKVQAGHWLDVSVVEDGQEFEFVGVSRDSRFPQANQYVLLVAGDSMDQEFLDGTFVICVDFPESGLAIKEDLIVHVERRGNGGQLVENTLKQIRRKGRGWELCPKSSNPRYKPFPIDSDEIVIRGVVIGDYRRR